MKKRWLSLIMLLCLCLGFVSGCKDEDGGNVEKLNVEGNDIVLKIGDTTYSANQLFADTLNTEEGAKIAYEKVLKMVVESSIEIDANMTASWELLLDSFEEKVKTNANTNSTSEEEARKALLAEEGYASIDEKKEKYFYDVRLSRLQEKFWKEKRNDYYEEYLTNRLPYYVRHALVKTSYTAARGPYATTIDSSDATALYKVYEMLAGDEKFSYIMNQLSEDTGSSSTAIGYHMDLTTSFVTEFLHGVFVFDALLKGKADKVTGLTSDVLNFYASSSSTGYGFNVINASDIVAMGKGDNATSTSYKNITTYNNVTDEDTGDVTERSVSSIYADYGSSYSSLYSRSIIFNQIFNNPSISVIAYDLDEENTPNNVALLNIDGVEKKVLTDDAGNIVFVACAKGSSSDLWIHFLTVSVSPFDENIGLFFSMDQEETIAKMVETRKAKLVEEGKTEAEITTLINTYKASLESYDTYVDIKGGEKQSDRNTVIEEIEKIIKTYANRGDADDESNQFLTYDMIEYYMDENEITITNTTIKTLVETYIANQKALIDSSSLNSIVSGWEGYYDLIKLTNSSEIVSKKIPMECSYVVNGDRELCKYNYETGFEILLSYNANDGVMPAAGTYKTSYHIGDDTIILPTPTKENYTFDGWYTSSDFQEGTNVTSIDTSKSSSSNKTKFYAKWTENGGEE